MIDPMNNATSAQHCKETAVVDDERLEKLLAHLQVLLPDASQVSQFRQAMLTEPGVDVRLSRLLPVARRFAPGLRSVSAPVPWCDDALRLPPELAAIVSHSLEFRLGALYLQAKATTLAVAALDPRPGELVLDLAAAPGGKATQIATVMGNTGLLVVNEPRHKRLASLVGNLERCGAHNTLVTSVLGAHLARCFHNVFDRVLLDAPCSGDGIVCKDRSMLRFWSPEDAVHKSAQQIGLLRAAFHMLRPGGRLVYSTCSLSTEENEDALLGLQKQFGRLVDIQVVPHIVDGDLAPEQLARYPEAFAGCARVWPHLHSTEGAFVAVIGKLGESEWFAVEEDAGPLLRHQSATPDAEGWLQRIAARWDFTPDMPPGYEVAAHGRHLDLRPAGAALLADRAWYVRSGMRLASLHKNHFFLSQQAVSLWGAQAQQRRLDVDLDQLQSLFRGEPCPIESPPLTGEVLCFHDELPICRGVVSRDGATLSGYVPKVARTVRLTRMLP
jgi:16S rRNA (cytosine1407-C5)-methyltransferase